MQIGRDVKLLVVGLFVLLAVTSGAGYLLLDTRIAGGEKELAAGQIQLLEGKSALAQGKAELVSGEQALSEGREAYKQASRTDCVVARAPNAVRAGNT